MQIITTFALQLLKQLLEIITKSRSEEEWVMERCWRWILSDQAQTLIFAMATKIFKNKGKCYPEDLLLSIIISQAPTPRAPASMSIRMSWMTNQTTSKPVWWSDPSPPPATHHDEEDIYQVVIVMGWKSEWMIWPSKHWLCGQEWTKQILKKIF